MTNKFEISNIEEKPVVKVRKAGETSPTVETKPKRKRRTKAEIEASNLATFEKNAKDAVAEFMRNKRNVRF